MGVVFSMQGGELILCVGFDVSHIVWSIVRGANHREDTCHAFNMAK